MLDQRADRDRELLAVLTTLFQAVADSTFRFLLLSLERTPPGSGGKGVAGGVSD